MTASLAQAYGVDTEYFSTNRAPGGTFGNRNFVAHVAAIGLPAIVWCTVTARRSIGALLGSVSVGLLAAALVLSRSRGAWLAVAASLIVLAGPVLVSRKYWAGRQVGGRFARLLLGAFAILAGAALLSWEGRATLDLGGSLIAGACRRRQVAGPEALDKSNRGARRVGTETAHASRVALCTLHIAGALRSINRVASITCTRNFARNANARPLLSRTSLIFAAVLLDTAKSRAL